MARLARARLEAPPGAVGLRHDGDREQAREAGIGAGRREPQVAAGAQRGPLQWSAVHVKTEGAGEGLAAAGFAAFALAVAFGRVIGDRVIDRFGRARTVRAAGTLAAAGVTVAMLAPAPAVAIAGWALLGAGVALVAPAVLGAAPEVTDLPAPVAIAAVTTIGYLGTFNGPPAIGALAELTSVSAALVLALLAAAAIAVLAPASLRRR